MIGTVLRRLREQFKIGNRLRMLPVGGTDAVAAGIAAANDDDMLSIGSNFGNIQRREIISFAAFILPGKIIHCKMNPFQFPSGNG